MQRTLGINADFSSCRQYDFKFISIYFAIIYIQYKFELVYMLIVEIIWYYIIIIIFNIKKKKIV